MLKISNKQVINQVINQQKPFKDVELLPSESSTLDPVWSEPFGAWEVYSISANLFYTNNY